MEIAYQYALHIMLFMVATTSIATGLIFKNNKSVSNALPFLGFCILTFALFSALFLGEIREPLVHNENTLRHQPFLSIYQSLILEVIAYSSIATGFVLKALNKPNK